MLRSNAIFNPFFHTSVLPDAVSNVSFLINSLTNTSTMSVLMHKYTTTKVINNKIIIKLKICFLLIFLKSK